jgi:hypothetical protein
VERLQKAGADVAITELADAGHAYEWSVLSSMVELLDAVTVRGSLLQKEHTL